jgi:beta-glucosidase
MTTRRDVLGGLAAATLAGSALGVPRGAGGAPRQRWPDRFVWGVATAAHQIEGNNIGSDYWVLEHVASTNFAAPSGDACDSWERWREDLKLVHGMGLTAYRFSIEWARIEPEQGYFSQAAMAHYRRICSACRELGIMPIVTFHHFTSPRWLAALGGWENPVAAEHFARYCTRAARALGDLAGAICTMNEPNAQVTSYLLRGKQPFPGEARVVAQAARAVGSDRFGAYFLGDSLKVRDVCLVAHRRAVDAIKSVLPATKVGMTLALQDLIAEPDGAALHARIFDEARRPFYAAAAQDDFIGVQPYTRLVTGRDGYLPASAGTLKNRYGADASANVLSAVVREVHRHCGAPILISEHGIDTEDDALRCAHLAASVDELHACHAQGIALLGYIHWSLLDNFEWRSGYAPKFGLVSVDLKNFARTPKPSAAAYRGIVAGALGAGRRRLERL